jgi:hypothetical protein
VLDVDPEYLLEVAAADDQQPVEALGADGTDPTLRVSVRVRRLHRRHDDFSALRVEHLVEGAAELGVAVAEQVADSSPSLTQGRKEIAGLLGDSGRFGVGGHRHRRDR